MNPEHPPYADEELESLSPASPAGIDAARLLATAPGAVARWLEPMEVDDRRTVLRLLPEEAAGAILAEMDGESAAEVVGAMREARAVAILESIDPDDAADVVAELEPADRDRLLGKLDPDTAEDVRTLLDYPEDSAGGIMTTEVATVPDHLSVGQVIDRIRELGEDPETYSYVYVVDARQRLVGVISLRRLILARPEQRITEVMVRQLRGVLRPEDDREHVAHLMAEVDLPQLPVVDAEGRLLGRITHDDVIDVLRDEATEDIQLLAGAGADETIDDALPFGVRRRLPWLVVNLGTAFLAAGVVLAFEEDIGRLPLLAAFMPVVAGIGGNTGQQTLAVAIRSLALREMPAGADIRIVARQGALALFNGLAVGVLAGLVGILLSARAEVGLVIFGAMLANMVLAGLAGAAIPLLLRRMKLDPAQSSTVFLTGITDSAGFLIFLALGSSLL